MVNNKVRMVAVALVSLVLGAGLGGVVAYSTKPNARSDPAHQRNDVVAGYGLLWSTLEDEATIDRLGLLKRITLDAPPDRILSIMAQVSKGANDTLAELARYRELEPRIARLPVTDSFGTVL